MHHRQLLALLFASILGATAPDASAGDIVYDFGRDWSWVQNPNCVWTLGYSQTQGGVVTPYTQRAFDSGLEEWNPGMTDPNFTHNPTTDPIPIGDQEWQPGETTFHPGPSNERSVARFTAPCTGTYQVSAFFAANNSSPTTTDVHVLVNGSEVFEAEINEFGPSSERSYAGTHSLATGDTVDTLVGWGANGNYFADSTEVAVRITRLADGNEDECPSCHCGANIQPPINADGTSIFNVKRGVVPVKFSLTCDGNPTCDLRPATIAVTRTAGGIIGEINESVYNSPADSGSNFRINGCQYHYNLNSKALGVGTYRVDILIDGQVVGSAAFQLE